MLKALMPAAAAVLAGCTGANLMSYVHQEHVILVELQNPSDRIEFERDCFQLVQPHGVVSVLTGPRLATDQPEAMRDYDTAVRVGLTTAEANARLPDHAAYQWLMEKWKPRSKSIRTISFGPRCEDDAPASDQPRP